MFDKPTHIVLKIFGGLLNEISFFGILKLELLLKGVGERGNESFIFIIKNRL